MKDIKRLSHSLTPDYLLALNQEIEQLITSDETDTARLADLIDQRHIRIVETLDNMPVGQRKAFASAETPINDYLNTFISAMLKESGDVLYNLRKGRSAVKKYNQAS